MDAKAYVLRTLRKTQNTSEQSERTKTTNEPHQYFAAVTLKLAWPGLNKILEITVLEGRK
jgi:hypothetical protein